ncbi:MAG TPA: ATP-dependent protease subunit HslV [Sphingomicrobium sp.]|nr:ATP-dependent protease subunit HslV [Sphingomicrobium sp.]
MDSWHGTTILGVKKDGKTVIAGDGQVSLGNTVIKPNAKKVRRIGEDGSVVAGFAGATADAFTLFERLEKKLEQYNGQLLRASVELAKDWRMDKYLRNLEAMMIVADRESMLILTGNGDVLEPEGGIAAIGSGGNYALAAARALSEYEPDPEVLARRAMEIAAEVCVFTNNQLTVETVEA